jgi:hypothetical protein
LKDFPLDLVDEAPGPSKFVTKATQMSGKLATYIAHLQQSDIVSPAVTIHVLLSHIDSVPNPLHISVQTKDELLTKLLSLGTPPFFEEWSRNKKAFKMVHNWIVVGAGLQGTAVHDAMNIKLLQVRLSDRLLRFVSDIIVYLIVPHQNSSDSHTSSMR